MKFLSLSCLPFLPLSIPHVAQDTCEAELKADGCPRTQHLWRQALVWTLRTNGATQNLEKAAAMSKGRMNAATLDRNPGRPPSFALCSLPASTAELLGPRPVSSITFHAGKHCFVPVTWKMLTDVCDLLLCQVLC